MWWRSPRSLSAAASLVAGAVLIFVFMVKDRPLAQPERLSGEPAKMRIEEARDRDRTSPDPLALAAVTLPAPPPEPATVSAAPPPDAKAPVEVKPLLASQPTVEPVREIKPLQPKEEAAPAAAEPEREIVPLHAKPEMQAKTIEPVRKIAPLRPAPAVPSASDAIREIRPLKALPREEPVRLTPDPIPAASPTVEKAVAKAIPEAPVPPNPGRAESGETAAGTLHVSAQTGGRIAKEGRALLKLLEHGSGPTIEIAWPRESGSRTQLYRTLAQCYGMRSIVMDSQGNLYIAEGAHGHKWDINLDRYSGFVRQPEGYLAGEERAIADAIRNYHGLRNSSGLVRIFPRQVDSVLLGGLQQILGDAYRDAKTIHGTYRQDGPRLYVEDIEHDGVKVEGRIAFSSINRGQCGG